MTIPAARRRAAIALVRRGHSVNEAAKRFGVSRKTIARWLASESEPDPAVDTKPDADPPEPHEPAVEGDDADDVLSLARGIIAEQKAIAQMAKDDHNTTAAARALKSAGDAANLIARLEQRRKASADTVTLTRVELDAARKRVHGLIDALRADLARTGGLVCATCGRAVRIALASNGTDPRGMAP